MRQQIENKGRQIMKIYIFDIDGNLLSIPTVFYMEEIATGRVRKFISTESYEIVNNMEKLGLRFNKSHSRTMRNFKGKLGDKMLLKDIKNAKYGPSWGDFVKCVNEASCFGIITARGNSIECLKKVFFDLIRNNTNGISFDKLLLNLKNNKIFNKLLESNAKDIKSDDEFLKFYIDKCCSFYGRNSKDTKNTLIGLNKNTSIPDFKVLALKDFENKIERTIKDYNIDIINEIIELGFSDDEELNCEIIKKYCESSGDIFKRNVYYTGKGVKDVIF